MTVVAGPDGLRSMLPLAFRLNLDPDTGAVRGYTVVPPPPKEIRDHGVAGWPGTIMIVLRWRAPAQGQMSAGRRRAMFDGA
jgi:hypothetical protein